MEAKRAGDITEAQDDALMALDVAGLVANWGATSAGAQAAAFALAFETDDTAWISDACIAQLLNAFASRKMELSGDEKKRATWLADQARSTVLYTLAPPESLVSAYCAFATDGSDGERVALLEQNAANLMKRRISDATKVAAVVDAFGTHPSPMVLTRTWWMELAMGLEGLHHRGRSSDIFRIMDTLLANKTVLDFQLRDAQYALSYPLVEAMKAGPQAFAEHIDPWLALGRIEDARLAFNLACSFAVKASALESHDSMFTETKNRMLNTIRDAIQLGKPADQFREDTDFAAFLDDTEFSAALATKIKEG